MAEAWYSFLINLTLPFYSIARVLFEVFFALAEGQLIQPHDYELLLSNFYVLLGIIILFIVAFNILKSIINPDEQKKGTETIKKMIVNTITSVLIIVLLPTIFGFAFDVQKSIVGSEYNVIGKFFGFGSSNAEAGTGNNNVSSAKQASYTVINGIYTAFFNVNPEYNENYSYNSTAELENIQSQITANGWFNKKNFKETIAEVNKTGKLGLYKSFTTAVKQEKIEFNFLFSIICGCILIWAIASFCIDMAVRLVKLVFYQMIAPIPVFFRIVPDSKLSGTFNQWVKVTFACYFEVYVRILIVYFVLFLCTQIKDAIAFNFGVTGFASLIVQALVWIGLITFMKQAPKLISEVTGIDSGNMKMGIREKLAQGGAFTAGAILGGGLTAGVRNATNAFQNNFEKGKDGKWHRKAGVTNAQLAKSVVTGGMSTMAGLLSGGVRSGYAGWGAKSERDMAGAAGKGAVAAVAARDKRASYRATHGNSLGGVIMGHLKDFGGSVHNYMFDESIEGLTRESQSMGRLASSYSSFSDTVENLLEKEQSKGGGSVFLGNGFQNNSLISSAYKTFDLQAQEYSRMQTLYNNGATGSIAKTQFNQRTGKYEYLLDNKGEKIYEDRKVTQDDLLAFQSLYVGARDDARDAILNLALKGSSDADYQGLDAKGQAALQETMVNAEALQASILENASSTVVQEIMGDGGNSALSKMLEEGEHLTVDDFKHNGTKLKDAAKVAKGQADVKIAEMNKEQAAKGDKK